MRNKERINPTLQKIEEIWRQYPDLRLMQLLGNCFSSQARAYHIEEDELLKLLDEVYQTNKGEKTIDFDELRKNK